MPTTTTLKSQYQPLVGMADMSTLLLDNPTAIVILVVIVIVGFIYKIGTKTEQEETKK
jgi:hypothetical protein